MRRDLLDSANIPEARRIRVRGTARRAVHRRGGDLMPRYFAAAWDWLFPMPATRDLITDQLAEAQREACYQDWAEYIP